jgi:hypothetical protein
MHGSLGESDGSMISLLRYFGMGSWITPTLTGTKFLGYNMTSLLRCPGLKNGSTAFGSVTGTECFVSMMALLTSGLLLGLYLVSFVDLVLFL